MPRVPSVSVLALAGVAALSGCDPVGVDGTDTVALTLRLQLAGGRDVGATPARVYVFSDSGAVPRGIAFPRDGEVCVLDTTPLTTCTLDVPRYSTITLIAAEPDPAVSVRFAALSAQDTVRDGRYVEFTGWTECPDRAERGLCVIEPSGDFTIEANFQMMQQVTIYQTGVALMDYITIAAAPTLKVPAQNDNILDLAGCRRVLNPPAVPCDAVRIVDDEPWHRFTAWVPRQTIVGMFPIGGAQTEFIRWDGACIPSSLYHLGVCSLITPDASGPPILLTARFDWWDCPSGPSDRDLGGCTQRLPPDPFATVQIPQVNAGLSLAAGLAGRRGPTWRQ